MGKAWIKRRRRDAYYRKAKAGGYRSRAVYKLLQIQDRFHLIHAGDVVVDLGAAPGGWSQLARELAVEGRVVAVDQNTVAPLEGVTFLRGDLMEDALLPALSQEIGGQADVVLSDASPKLSGNRTLDHARSVDLAARSFFLASRLLRTGGQFATKVFQGEAYPALRRQVNRAFRQAKGFTPPASPARSAEIYLVGKGWRGPGPP